jgi:hypothetical protein
MIEHLARHWGDWASVVGLVFSFLAFVFSKRASKAAEEARDSVLQRSFGQDMNDANQVATEIVRFVSMNRGDMASLRASELMSQTSYFMARWKGKLSEDSEKNLVRARDKLLSGIHKTMVEKALDDLNPDEKFKLSRACQQVSSIFSAEHGNAIRGTDKEVSQ